MPTRQTDTFHLNLDSHTLLRFNTRLALFSHAQVAQSVEQRIENPRVGGSIPPLGTTNNKSLALRGFFVRLHKARMRASNWFAKQPDRLFR